ncbi:MAG TPA: HAMP domain-containing sensor histidine kinase [Herpetosiphonaceae bacterium]|nr:HAMP domain-containing sensor histidine kinase [Herpetosiphonaceae bacterium]
MKSTGGPDIPSPLELRRFLGVSLSQVRWITILALLVLTMLEPPMHGHGLPAWGLILLFAAYNLAVDLCRGLTGWARCFHFAMLLDLPVAGLIYWLGGEPNGPLFDLFFLAVVCAAATMTLRGSLIYTLIAVGLAIALNPAFGPVAKTRAELADLGAGLVVLALSGVGTAILTRRLAMEQAASRAVRDEAERLEQLDRIRGAFISTISHNLQTPLTAARAGLGLAEASLADRLHPDEQQLLANVRRNIERLRIHINDLLAYNQFEAGALRLELEPLDLRRVVTDAMATVYPLMREKGQVLEVDLPEPLPYTGDRRRLEQVVVNLLSNAHRHTSSGTHITICGRADRHEACLSVSDNGPGIPRQELEDIFERFHRLDASQDGSGLGLPIARRLVVLHGGRIWAESEPGKGAAFQVVLPQRDGEGEV